MWVTHSSTCSHVEKQGQAEANHLWGGSEGGRAAASPTHERGGKFGDRDLPKANPSSLGCFASRCRDHQPPGLLSSLGGSFFPGGPALLPCCGSSSFQAEADLYHHTQSPAPPPCGAPPRTFSQEPSRGLIQGPGAQQHHQPFLKSSPASSQLPGPARVPVLGSGMLETQRSCPQHLPATSVSPRPASLPDQRAVPSATAPQYGPIPQPLLGEGVSKPLEKRSPNRPKPQAGETGLAATLLDTAGAGPGTVGGFPPLREMLTGDQNSLSGEYHARRTYG